MADIYEVTQGDATDFAGNKFMAISLANTPSDMSKYKGRFQVCDVIKDYSDVSSLKVEVSLSATDTLKLPVGIQYASFMLIDPDNKPCTILKDIQIKVNPQKVKND